MIGGPGQKSKVKRPRGMCWSCYYRPGVRKQYPPTSKSAGRGVGNFCGTAPLPAVSTDAAPGSEEKITILEERAKNRQSLWHPDDLTLETVPNSAAALAQAC